MIAGEVGTFEWDVYADRLWGDQNFARMFNVQLDAGGAAPLADYIAAIHPEDRDGVQLAIHQTLENGSDLQCEYRVGDLTTRDGLWLAETGT